MTRKKAIEASVAYGLAQADKPGANISIRWNAAEHAFDRGRIAGLREAAHLVANAIASRIPFPETVPYGRAKELEKKLKGKP